MSERMPRIIVSIPQKMLNEFRLVVAADGRSQGELVRMLIGTFIEARQAQAAVISNLKASMDRLKRV